MVDRMEASTGNAEKDMETPAEAAKQEGRL
jgi:hypothetical protein